jgi:hypothetical protein
VSERFTKSLEGDFKEAEERTIEIDDEDPELFGYFIEYVYRDRSILSREVQHCSKYITLARLYAMGERIMVPAFQTYCFWTFTQSLEVRSPVSDEGMYELLQLACTKITERFREDPLRSPIFRYCGDKITTLQKSALFRQLLHELPELGRQLCIWVHRDQPRKAATPN